MRTLPLISEVCNGVRKHNMGVFLKTNVVLGGVQDSVTKSDKRVGGFQKVKKNSLTYFMDTPKVNFTTSCSKHNYNNLCGN